MCTFSLVVKWAVARLTACDNQKNLRDMPADPASLRKVEILNALSDGEVAELGNEVIEITLQPRQPIVRHLENKSEVYFILDGVCAAILETPYGRIVPLRDLRAGDHFGELAALTGAPRSVSVEARTQVLLAQCNAMTFKAFMQGNAAFASAVAANLAKSVVALTDRFYELAALEVPFRLYAELLRLARSGRQTEEGIVIENVPTHNVLAASINARREYVTRELSQLSAEGIISHTRGTLVLRDIDKLRDMVERRGGLTASQLVDWRL